MVFGGRPTWISACEGAPPFRFRRSTGRGWTPKLGGERTWKQGRYGTTAPLLRSTRPAMGGRIAGRLSNFTVAIRFRKEREQSRFFTVATGTDAPGFVTTSFALLPLRSRSPPGDGPMLPVQAAPIDEWWRIPAELNAQSGGKPNGVRDDPEHLRSDPGFSILWEMFGFVNRSLSGARRRKDAAGGESGSGRGWQGLTQRA